MTNYIPQGKGDPEYEALLARVRDNPTPDRLKVLTDRLKDIPFGQPIPKELIADLVKTCEDGSKRDREVAQAYIAYADRQSGGQFR